MEIVESPDFVESWVDEPVFGVFIWAKDSWGTWFRLHDCNVHEVLDWASERAGTTAYSVALLVADPTEPPNERDGIIWLLGGDVRAGQEPHRH